jgi:hypothetical protein
MTVPFPIEVRESDGGPMLSGVIIQEGRAAAAGRAELFAPGAIVWPQNGIGILTEHHGRAHAYVTPARDALGNITVSAPAPPAVVEAFEAGKRHMSIEFMPLREVRTAAGIREIQRALVDAATLTANPEYAQARAEVRERRRFIV